MKSNPRHPHADHVYAWCTRVIDGNPQINFSNFNGIPNGVELGLTRLKTSPTYDNCFITGVKLYFTNEPTRLQIKNPIWAASKEHLMSIKHHREHYLTSNPMVLQGPSYLLPPNAVVLCGVRVNKHLGHDPASLKLEFKRFLLDKQYDRSDPTGASGNYEIIRKYWIDFTEQYKFQGKYPWQPWTYTDIKDRERAQIYLNHLIAWERILFENMALKDRKVLLTTVELPSHKIG